MYIFTPETNTTDMSTRKKFPLYLQILAGMVAGILAGVIALRFENGIVFVQHWIQPWGQVFIRLLQLIAVPLIFVSLIKGVTGLKDISKLSRLGGKTLGLYLFTITVSVIVGLTLALTVEPGSFVDSEKVAHIQQSYEASVADKALAAQQAHNAGPLSFLNEIVPGNIVSAASNNSSMLQVVFFSIFFGLAALMVPQEKVKPVLAFFEGLDDIILKMVDYIIRMAPVGVAALMAALVVDFKGDASIFSALGIYALTVTVGMFILMIFFYPLLIHFFSKLPAMKFFRAMYPVQLFAFTTSSSAATLPVSMKAVEEKLNVSADVTSFVLPVGTTVNMDGTSCYQAIATLFIAQVLGIDLSFSQILVVLMMTILSSIGTPSIPGGSYVILALVLTSVGIPAEGLALIIGIDRPLDMLRTAVNVTGDAVVAVMVDR